MNPTTLSRRDALLLLGATAITATSRAGGVPGDSIYQLHPALTDQDGHPFDPASMRGSPVIATMFYSSCEMVCPVIFETVAQIVKSLKPSVRDRVRVMMVSFDPERDTVPVLKETATRHGCDAHWSLVRGSDADVRRIAALLGVQYRRLASGEFNHSSSIQLLDAEGRIVKRTGKLGEIDPAFIAAVQSS